jgi:acyl-CoA synthetase (AMP-forming)/AMP-acid ligase II
MAMFDSIVEAVRTHARCQERSRLIFPGERIELSYADLWTRAGGHAAGLRNHGVKAGDRLALMMVNNTDTVILTVAAMRLGCTIVPLVYRPGLKVDGADAIAIANAARAGRAKWCVAPAAAIETLHGVFKKHSLALEVIPAGDLRCPDEPDANTQAFAGEWPVLLQFSAGSTGEPKGILLTAGNLLSNVAGIYSRIRALAGDRLYSWLPLYHDMGLVGGLFTCFYAGGTMILSTPTDFIRNPLGWLQGMSEFRATITVAPQFAYGLCLAKSEVAWPSISGCDLSSVRLMLNGAEHVDYDACERFEREFGRLGLRRHAIQPSYGLAENCAAVSLRDPETPVAVRYFRRSDLHNVPPPEDGAAGLMKLAANGTPLAGTQVRIGDGTNPETPGEIYVSGPATVRMMTDSSGELTPAGTQGWVPTGDIGVVLDGEIYVVGRSKEIIKRGGRTFSPADIEQAVHSVLPSSMCGAAVIGYLETATGSEELAVVVEYPARKSDATLKDRIRLRLLSEFQLAPHQVWVVLPGEIPRTSSGKIRRVLLRDAVASGRLREMVRFHPAFTDGTEPLEIARAAT